MKIFVFALVLPFLWRKPGFVGWNNSETGARPGFPVSDFFRGLLHYWGVQVHHLTPNSILHISIFVHLCEAFLGIEPHFDLFQYFFHLKPHSNDSKIDVVGGAGLQFRQGKQPKYIPYDLSDKVVDWLTSFRAPL